MKRMAEYQRLDEVCHNNMGQSPDSKSYNQEGVGLPFFQGNADFGAMYPETRVWCSSPTKIVEAGTLLISVRAPIGALNFAKERSCIGRGLAGITPQNGVSLKYIYYCLKGKNKELNAKGTGSTFKAIAKSALGETSVKIVSEEDQLKIIQTLDRVSSVIEARKQQLTELDNLIKARFVEMFGMPGTDTKGWGLQYLGTCCELNPKKGTDKRLVSGLSVSFVPMPAVSESGKIDASQIKAYDEVKTGFTYFAENDVLFAKITPCMENGKGAVAVGLCNNIGFGSTEFHILRPINNKSNPYWLYSLTSFDAFRKDAADNMTGSAGQRRVPAVFLEKYKVTLPPIELQNQFAAFVKQTDKSKVAVQKSLDEAQLLFDSLMQQYFG